MKSKKRFFTLIEILVVVAIIGILAGIALGITGYVQNRNREIQTQTTIAMLEMIVNQYKDKYGSFPALNGKPSDSLGTAVFKLPAKPEEGDKLIVLFNDISYNGSDEITGIKGVNIAKVGNDILILDGWGSPIIYVYPGVFKKNGVDFGSPGSDKMLGENASAKFNGTALPNLGSRSSGAYKSDFGKADDITNFKRTDK